MRSFVFALPVLMLAVLARGVRADDIQIQSAEQTIETTDHATRLTYTYYDALGRQTQTTDPSGNTVTYTYHGDTTTSDPGRVTTYTYQAQDQTIATTDPIGHTTTYQYDQSGLEGKTGATTYTYDPGFSPVPDSVDTDAADPGRGTTTYQFDNLNRQTSEVDALGRTTTYTYYPDVTGPASITGGDALGNTTRYQYDTNSHTIQSTDAIGGVTSTSYDADGETVVEFSAPITTTYTYHADGSLLSSAGPDGTITYTLYDETTATYKYQYDSVGGPVEADGTLTPGDSYELRFSYTYYDDAGSPSTGTASMSLALTASPEPGSLGILFGVLPVVLRRRKRS